MTIPSRTIALVLLAALAGFIAAPGAHCAAARLQRASVAQTTLPSTSAFTGQEGASCVVAAAPQNIHTLLVASVSSRDHDAAALVAVPAADPQRGEMFAGPPRSSFLFSPRAPLQAVLRI